MSNITFDGERIYLNVPMKAQPNGWIYFILLSDVQRVTESKDATVFWFRDGSKQRFYGSRQDKDRVQGFWKTYQARIAREHNLLALMGALHDKVTVLAEMMSESRQKRKQEYED